MADITELHIGQELCWLHGDCHMIGTVLEFDGDKVKIAGMTTDYWVRTKVMLDKLNRLYPGMNSMYALNE